MLIPVTMGASDISLFTAVWRFNFLPKQLVMFIRRNFSDPFYQVWIGRKIGSGEYAETQCSYCYHWIFLIIVLSKYSYAQICVKTVPYIGEASSSGEPINGGIIFGRSPELDWCWTIRLRFVRASSELLGYVSWLDYSISLSTFPWDHCPLVMYLWQHYQQQ